MDHEMGRDKPESGLEKASAQVGSRVAVVSMEAARLKRGLTGAAHGAVTQTQRAARATYDQAGILIEEAGDCIKRNPFYAVGVAFGAGVGIGFALDRAFKR